MKRPPKLRPSQVVRFPASIHPPCWTSCFNNAKQNDSTRNLEKKRLMITRHLDRVYMPCQMCTYSGCMFHLTSNPLYSFLGGPWSQQGFIIPSPSGSCHTSRMFAVHWIQHGCSFSDFRPLLLVPAPRASGPTGGEGGHILLTYETLVKNQTYFIVYFFFFICKD